MNNEQRKANHPNKIKDKEKKNPRQSGTREKKKIPTYIYVLAGIPAAKRSRCVRFVSISSFLAVQGTHMIFPITRHTIFFPDFHHSVHSHESFLGV